MKKRYLILAILICSIILLFPIKRQYEDGGTVQYAAILYSITYWHAIDESYESGYYEATEFNIFPFNFINQ